MNKLHKIPRFLVPNHSTVIQESEVEQIIFNLYKKRFSIKLIQRRHRNEVFKVGDFAIFKLFIQETNLRSSSNIYALNHLNNLDLCIPKLLNKGNFKGYFWSLETFLNFNHHRNVSDKEHLHMHYALGQWLKKFHISINTIHPFGYLSKVTTSDNIITYLSNALTLEIESSKNSPHNKLIKKIEKSLLTLLDIIHNNQTVITPVLLHGSYTLANVGCEKINNEYIVSAVFDFEESHYGDPMEDLALVGIYGMQDLRFKNLINAYKITGNDILRAAYWIGIRAIEILIWTPILGDKDYENVAICASRDIIDFISYQNTICKRKE